MLIEHIEEPAVPHTTMLHAAGKPHPASISQHAHRPSQDVPGYVYPGHFDSAKRACWLSQHSYNHIEQLPTCA
jgi:hypothetical protein